jgi:hypothetical protein
MYAFSEMLKGTGQVWPTEAHKTVAEAVLIGNGRYFTMSDLKNGAEIIASIPEDRIKLVTAADLSAMGVMLP